MTAPQLPHSSSSGSPQRITQINRSFRLLADLPCWPFLLSPDVASESSLPPVPWAASVNRLELGDEMKAFAIPCKAHPLFLEKLKLKPREV